MKKRLTQSFFITGTQDVTPVPFSLGGKAITLIDTPGFDDSERTDADILSLVATYMAKTYEQGMLLHGIIFLQPINQPRLQGSEKRRTRLFKNLLGEDAYQRVVVATTMWNQVSESEGRQRQDERESRPDVWGDMVSRGARVVRHDDDQGSATSIISSLTQYSSPVTLKIQEELAQNGGRVADTSAGKQLDEDLGETIVKLRREIEALTRERSNTAEEMRELREKIGQLETERQELKESNVSTTISPRLPERLSLVVLQLCGSWLSLVGGPLEGVGDPSLRHPRYHRRGWYHRPTCNLCGSLTSVSWHVHCDNTF